jgi:homoserine O-acetyltransferase
MPSEEIDPAFFQENERTAPSVNLRRTFEAGPLQCDSGSKLDAVTLAYECWGDSTTAADRSILVCHALSGDSHAVGWWDRLVGPGKAIDTNHYHVISVNALGGCQGSTGPSSLAPDGRHYGSRFPVITLRDIVEPIWRLLRSLGIEQLAGVAGGSMGGMTALEVCRQGPVKKAFVTAAARAHSAMQIGFNETARQAIMRDSKWLGGDYPLDDPPIQGLAVARMLGHLSYLSEESFDRKFGRRSQCGEQFRYTLSTEFAVESYLNYQGEKFTKRFDPNSLLILSKALDYYEFPGFHDLSTEWLFTSFSSDLLYPSHQSETMHQLAKSAGCASRHFEINLPFGHDAFLLDDQHQGAAVREFFDA